MRSTPAGEKIVICLQEIVKTMKIRVRTYIFSVVAFGMFVFALTLAKDDPIRAQALYWLGLSAVFSVFPEIQRFKIKDLEVELKKNLEKVEKQVDELSDTFFITIDRVWKEENDMPNILKEKRNQHWDKFQKYMDSLNEDEKLQAQIKNTSYYLNDYKISPGQLKENLASIGFFQAPLNNELDKTLIDSIIEFQRSQKLRHVDGVFGPLTYQKLIDVIERKNRKNNGLKAK